MTPIERAARALAAQHGELVAGGLAQDCTDWDRQKWSDSWRSYERQVRDVLEAIREPSAAVSLAMARAMEDRMPCDSGEDPPQAEVMVEYGVPQAAAAAMFDKMLEEG